MHPAKYGALCALIASAALEPIDIEAREAPVVAWSPETALEDASQARRPSLVFFRAQWSCAGKELELETFSDPRVRRALTGFVTVKIDMTDDESEDVQRALRTYAVRGEPTVLLFDPEGREVARIESWVPPETLLPLLDGAPGGAPTRDGLF
jgi:thiol:disulfide interchange protein